MSTILLSSIKWMAQIQIAVRNESQRSMASVGGTFFLAILASNGQVIASKNVSIMFADAEFPNLQPGKYQCLVRHPEVQPTQAEWEVELQTEADLLQVLFIYSEPERVLLRVRTQLSGGLF
jgi:hypothetical protein